MINSLKRTLYQMENLIFAHQFLKNFAKINFCDSTVSGIEKRIVFRDFGQIPRNCLLLRYSSVPHKGGVFIVGGPRLSLRGKPYISVEQGLKSAFGRMR